MKNTKAIQRTVAMALISLSILLFTGCAGNVDPSHADKFAGTWNGSYGCEGTPLVADQMIIAKQPDGGGFAITIHATTVNPDTVTGQLASENTIKITEQSMGGGPGKAKITFQNDGTLNFVQSGGGLTCTGSGYTKVQP